MEKNLYEQFKKRVSDYDETIFYDAENLYQSNSDPDAAYILGLCLISEVGTAPNGKLGVKLLKQAVQSKNIDAYLLLGDAFSGDYFPYVKPKYKLSYKYYKMAADAGNLEGKSKLGNLIYTNGNFKEGFDLVKDAYDEGYIGDAWLLSRYYETGQAVEKSPEMTFKIINDVVTKSEYEYIRLGRFYKNGTGVEKNEEMAFKLFSAASTLNSKVGMRELAMCYYLGIGTAKSIELGNKYLEKAIDHGDFKALDYKAEIDFNDINNFDFNKLYETDNTQLENMMRYMAVKKKLKWSKNLR